MKRANIALAIVSFIAISTSVFLLVRNNRSDEEDLREEDQLEIVKKLHTTIEVYLVESNPDPNSRRFSVPWNKDVIYVVGAPKIDTADIINAQFQELTAKTSGIVLVFTTNGEKKWNDLTAAHYGKRIAVVVDQRLLCLPVLRSNRSQAGPLLISGTFSPDEARRIASGINANWKKKSR